MYYKTPCTSLLGSVCLALTATHQELRHEKIESKMLKRTHTDLHRTNT
uniref:Uncharacterized protein n=1 Tax=Romanomermis culicivorax TaxID=13658 RepID=A0A915IQB4_ROMCU